jgi:hypothetical protein
MESDLLQNAVAWTNLGALYLQHENIKVSKMMLVD